MMKCLPFAIALLLLLPAFSRAQSDNNNTESIAKSNAEAEKKAAEWTTGLKLTDTVNESRVATAITIHLKAIRDWNNEHPFTTVPAGINPATGNKLSELDRQIIVNSSMPASIHKDLLDVLNKEL